MLREHYRNMLGNCIGDAQLREMLRGLEIAIGHIKTTGQISKVDDSMQSITFAEVADPVQTSSDRDTIIRDPYCVLEEVQRHLGHLDYQSSARYRFAKPPETPRAAVDLEEYPQIEQMAIDPALARFAQIDDVEFEKLYDLTKRHYDYLLGRGKVLGPEEYHCLRRRLDSVRFSRLGMKVRIAKIVERIVAKSPCPQLGEAYRKQLYSQLAARIFVDKPEARFSHLEKKLKRCYQICEDAGLSLELLFDTMSCESRQHLLKLALIQGRITNQTLKEIQSEIETCAILGDLPEDFVKELIGNCRVAEEVEGSRSVRARVADGGVDALGGPSAGAVVDRAADGPEVDRARQLDGVPLGQGAGAPVWT
jgi:hypothetical protein